jgi:hypothetical protein
MKSIMHKRRTVRMRKVILLKGMFNDIDGMAMKWAGTVDELRRAFALVHEEYLRAGYIKGPTSSGMLFNIHNLLPSTNVLVIKCREEVISTVSLIRDTEHFGLPMDSIYSDELNGLRKKGRSLSEACGLATSGKFRWRNIFMFSFRKMYWHAINNGASDICIMVNPKHVAFYKTIFLFEELGPEKFYPRLGVPAVALRMNLEDHEVNLRQAYSDFDPDCNLYHFFYEGRAEAIEDMKWKVNLHEKPSKTEKIFHYFLDRKMDVFEKLTPVQKDYVLGFYRALEAAH